MVRSRAFWSSLLSLPVVVARAHSFVTIETRGNTEALPAALLAEEHAWFVVLCPAAPPCALIWALGDLQAVGSISITVQVIL